MNVQIITIDGPAAAGKTTLAGRLATSFSIGVMNSGAMYRAATWVMRRESLQQGSEEEICDALKKANLSLKETSDGSRLFFGEQEITDELTLPDLTREIKLVADLPKVREFVGEWQEELCSGHWIVTEGRDQGTEVFPTAAVKIFLTATIDERVARRARQMEGQDVAALKKDMEARDRSDRERPVGALRQPEDSLYLDNSDLTIDETVDKAKTYVEETLKTRGMVLQSNS